MFSSVPTKDFRTISDSDFNRLSAHISPQELSGKTILVSGATGFFGAWILALFSWIQLKHSIQFRVLAISRDPLAFERKHPWIKSAIWITWIKGDIKSFPFPDCHVDYVIHAATDTSAAAASAPDQLLSSIIAGTEHMLACAKSCGTSRVLLVSSGGVYGAQPADMAQVSESAAIAPSTLEVGSAYGEGKRVMELLGAIHAKQTTCQVTIARCFAFVGAGLPLDTHFAIGNFIRDAAHAEKITIRGDGKGVRSYLYAADLVIWLLQLLLRGESPHAYNVGSDEEVTIANLAHTVIATLAPYKSVLIEGLGNSSPVGNRYVPSILRARQDLALAVWTSLADAIKYTAQWTTE